MGVEEFFHHNSVYWNWKPSNMDSHQLFQVFNDRALQPDRTDYFFSIFYLIYSNVGISMLGPYFFEKSLYPTDQLCFPRPMPFFTQNLPRPQPFPKE